MYEEGLGVQQDYQTAVKWFALAAEQGIAEAQLVLGAMYCGGHGNRAYVGKYCGSEWQ